MPRIPSMEHQTNVRTEAVDFGHKMCTRLLVSDHGEGVV